MGMRDLFILILFSLLTSNSVCKATSETTEDDKQVEGSENLAELASPVIVGAIGGGVFVFLCVVTAVVCLCKKCTKCCSCRTKPELEMGVPSEGPSEGVSEGASESASEGASEDASEDASEGASEKVDVDTPKTETVVNLPEQTSLLHSSSTCSQVSGSPTGTPRSSSWSLLSLFSLPLASKPEILSCPEPEPSLESEKEICTQSSPLAPSSVLSLTNISTGSPISLSAISLTFEPEDLPSVPATSSLDFPETLTNQCALKESTVPLANSSYIYIPDDSQSLPSAKPVTPNEPFSEKRSFFEEITRTVVSLVTKHSSSFTESCKTPVAPTNDVIITIDEDDVHEGGTDKATDNVVIDIASKEEENDIVLVTDDDDGTPGTLPIASERHSPVGLEGDLTPVVSSRISGEERAVDLKNKEKRLLIKQQTQHTKCFLNESILCAKAVIMNEVNTKATAFHSTLNPFAKPFVPAALKKTVSCTPTTSESWNSSTSKTAQNQEEAKPTRQTRQKRISNKHRPDRALYIPPVKALWQNYQQK